MPEVIKFDQRRSLKISVKNEKNRDSLISKSNELMPLDVSSS